MILQHFHIFWLHKHFTDFFFFDYIHLSIHYKITESRRWFNWSSRPSFITLLQTAWLRLSWLTSTCRLTRWFIRWLSTRQLLTSCLLTRWLLTRWMLTRWLLIRWLIQQWRITGWYFEFLFSLVKTSISLFQMTSISPYFLTTKGFNNVWPWRIMFFYNPSWYQLWGIFVYYNCVTRFKISERFTSKLL